MFVTPRLDARKKRISEAHTARDTFGTHLMTVLATCSLLEQTPIDDPAWRPVLRDRIKGERERWLQQLDDATRWMVDNVAVYAGSWPLQRHKDFAVSYAASARGVVLSEREEATKRALLLGLTTPVQRQFFGFWWTRARHFTSDQGSFAATLARLNSEEPPAP
ncbi:hypothetical protein ACIRJM_48960 [Streptomyces sp. NPDC102405]|uniref:hypothetical protein n=1 Tax=Streptomyces sp. NPDC102405 TaxID=3366170 RepID=UPI0037FA30E1